jgi:hypothetical protein
MVGRKRMQRINAYIIQRVKQWNCKKRRDIKPRTKSSNKAATINRDPRPKDPKQIESTTRTESWQRVRKEEREG